MKYKLQDIFSSKMIAGMAILFFLAAISSCTKSSSSGNDGAKFIGTWNGTSSCGGTATFSFNAGSNGNTVTTSGTVGNTGCVKAITVNLTAGGNNLTLPSQTFTDGCGLTYTFTGSGSLNGSTLTLTEAVAGAVNETCTFTGTK